MSPSPAPPDADGYRGAARPADNVGIPNGVAFAIRSLIGRVNTATLVKVLEVTSPGGLAPVGYVKVQPLVNAVDGDGTVVAHLPLSNLPYMRLQGGANAVVIDPRPGDIGLAIFATTDIGTVKTTRAQAAPASPRRHHLSDGLYVGGYLNGAPTQYVLFDDDGVTVVSPTKVKIQSPSVEIDGPVTVNGALTATGNITAGQGGSGAVDLLGHVHGGVQAGSAQTGGPVG